MPAPTSSADAERRKQLCLTLHGEGLTTGEIANRLSISVNAVEAAVRGSTDPMVLPRSKMPAPCLGRRETPYTVVVSKVLALGLDECLRVPYPRETSTTASRRRWATGVRRAFRDRNIPIESRTDESYIWLAKKAGTDGG